MCNGCVSIIGLMISLLIRTKGDILTLSTPHHQPKRGSDLKSLDILKGGFIGVDKLSGKITYVSTHAPSETRTDCEELDVGDRVILPGFVDCHNHLIWHGSRAHEFYKRCMGVPYQQIAQEGGGILYTREKTLSASDEELLIKARANLAELIRNGVTATEAKSGYALTPEGELRLLRLISTLRRQYGNFIVPTFLVHGIAEEYRDNRDEFVAQMIGVLERAKAENLAEFCDVFVDSNALTLEEARRILLEASTRGFKLRLHADQFSDDGTSRLGLELSATTVDHIDFIGEETIRALADSNVACVLLPGASFFSGSKAYPPARKLIDRGAIVALATDLNPGSSHIFSPAFIMTLASLELKMSAEECISAFTKNAAYALGLCYHKGSLAPGMDADIIVLNTDSYMDIGYMVGADIVDTVIARGRFLKRDGSFTYELKEVEVGQGID